MTMVGTADVSMLSNCQHLAEDQVVVRVVINLIGLQADTRELSRQGFQVGFGCGAMWAAFPPEQVDRDRVDGGFCLRRDFSETEQPRRHHRDQQK